VSGPAGDSAPEAAIFDLDGVITFTAHLHAAAWKALFDAFLRRHAATTGTPFVPFDAERDYLAYVDGRPRLDGIRTFLASRGIELPEGSPSDPAEADTVAALGERKNVLFRERLEALGVEVDPAAVRLVRELRARGVRVGVASSSKNTERILRRAGLDDLFEARVDGVERERLGLEGKPAPDIFLECLRRLGRDDPGRSLLAEDAVVGVEAGRAGGFGLVLGVDRGGNWIRLREHGGDWIVQDFRRVTADRIAEYFRCRRHVKPNAIAAWPELERALAGRRLSVFIDVAALAGPGAGLGDVEVRATLNALAEIWPTTVVSDGPDAAGRVARSLRGVDGIEVAGVDRVERALAASRSGTGLPLYIAVAPWAEVESGSAAGVRAGDGAGSKREPLTEKVVAAGGIAVLVTELPRPTRAPYTLQAPLEVRAFLDRVAQVRG